MKLGEIRSAKEIGRKGAFHYIWAACEDCGKERWVLFCKGVPRSKGRCHICAEHYQRGSNSPHWKGGKIKGAGGYIFVKLQPGDFFYSMANCHGYVREHRLVVAKALGRCLHLWELVHHKHAKYPAGSVEDKQDNRYPENLQLVSDIGHSQITLLGNKIDNQSNLIRELKGLIESQTKQIRLLQWQLTEGIQDKVGGLL